MYQRLCTQHISGWQPVGLLRCYLSCRVFRLNGKLATRTAVRQALVKEHVFGEFSFVRQAQVAELVQNSSSGMLGQVISGALVEVVVR